MATVSRKCGKVQNGRGALPVSPPFAFLPPFALLNLNPMTMWVLNVVPIAKVSLNLNHHVGRGQG